MSRPFASDVLSDQELIKAIGEINLRWDEIEMYLWYLFDSLLGTQHWRQSYVIYFAHPNHRVRREMIEALLEETRSIPAARKQKFRALLRRVKNAAGKRNHLAHGLWSTSGGSINRMALSRTLKKLGPEYSKADILKTRDEIKKLDGDLFRLVYPYWQETATEENGRASIKADPIPDHFD
jgi:hypothetical protein